eukprot:jgi/Undpi1/8131/HiC_scaffold_24.g10602.m1
MKPPGKEGDDGARGGGGGGDDAGADDGGGGGGGDGGGGAGGGLGRGRDLGRGGGGSTPNVPGLLRKEDPHNRANWETITKLPDERYLKLGRPAFLGDKGIKLTDHVDISLELDMGELSDKPG